MKIGCVLKAAGKSLRFGRNKLLEELNGKTVIECTIDSIPVNRFEKLVAVTSSEEVNRLCIARGIETVMYGGGPVSETIRLGLGKMAFLDGCIFVSGDQPLCSTRSYERLVDAFMKDPERVFRLSYNGVPGSPVLFPERLFPRLMALKGEKGGISVVNKTELCLVSADFEYELMDADTEEQLAQIRNFLV